MQCGLLTWLFALPVMNICWSVVDSVVESGGQAVHTHTHTQSAHPSGTVYNSSNIISELAEQTPLKA